MNIIKKTVQAERKRVLVTQKITEVCIKFILIDRIFQFISINRISVEGHLVIIMINSRHKHTIEPVIKNMLPVEVRVFVIIPVRGIAVQIELVAADIPIYKDVVFAVDFTVDMNGSVAERSATMTIIFWQ